MTLHHGDCVEVMAQMEPESVDAIDRELLAQAWWVCVNEPEDGPWEHASDDDRSNAQAWADELIRHYGCFARQRP